MAQIMSDKRIWKFCFLQGEFLEAFVVLKQFHSLLKQLEVGKKITFYWKILVIGTEENFVSKLVAGQN